MIPPSSPSQLTPPGQGPGVRRLNRVPLALLCVAAGAGVFVLGYAIVKRHTQQIAAQEETLPKKTQGSTTPDFLKVPASNSAPVKEADKGPPPKVQPSAPPPPPPAIVVPNSLEEQARAQAWQAYWQTKAQAMAAHNALEQSALSGSMDPLHSSGTASTEPAPETGGPPAATIADGAKGGLPYSIGGVNPEGQTGKQAFLRTAGDPYGQNEDVPGSVHGPKSNTIMEGTPILARLVDAATSDMPGQLVAEVMSNVYDDMTGDVLLIPQGTRVITTYDIAVSVGQNRVGTIAQRLVFPDTSSRQLGSMQVADETGAAGMHDLLNTHFWEKLGTALTISLVGAGAQLSQPQQSAFATPSGTSVATGAMTQQLSQFGMAQAQTMANRPNTIELRAGLPFLVKLNKDLTLPPYVDKRYLQSSTKASMTIGKLVQ